MQHIPTIKYFSIALCVLLVMAELASSAPAYNDYESVKDLYEMLLQREAMDEQLRAQQHLLVRKSNRSPSLRLRFGKRSENLLPGSSQYLGHQLPLLDDNLQENN